jgi:preprotein translocase subunit SecE
MNAWTTVVVSVLVAIILGVMDMVFGNLTNFILGGAA